MKTYPIPMVPGPVSVPRRVMEAYLTDYGSADMEVEFLELYRHTAQQMQQLFGTSQDVVLHTGEGMIALWGALKSVIVPGDRVLAISTGIFGGGIGAMAASIGANVMTVEYEFNQTVNDLGKVEEAIRSFQPKMITVVHCETPSGTLNPIDGIGALKQEYQVPLLYMDCVASMGGAEVLTDAWNVDLALGGSQKVLSVPPGMSMIAVSENAWKIAEEVKYVGYDALLPLRNAEREPGVFPYTPDWHGVAALSAGADLILEEGLAACFARHEAVAAYTRQRLQAMGIPLFYAPDAIPSPTVTAAMVPDGWEWADFDAALRAQGLVVGGSYGPMAGKVFRLGHMGSQATLELVDQALSIIQKVISR